MHINGIIILFTLKLTNNMQIDNYIQHNRYYKRTVNVLFKITDACYHLPAVRKMSLKKSFTRERCVIIVKSKLIDFFSNSRLRGNHINMLNFKQRTYSTKIHQP